MIIFPPPSLHKYFRFFQHVDDLLCGESFSRYACLSHQYSTGSSLTFKVDPFLRGRSITHKNKGNAYQERPLSVMDMIVLIAMLFLGTGILEQLYYFVITFFLRNYYGRTPPGVSYIHISARIQ